MALAGLWFAAFDDRPFVRARERHADDGGIGRFNGGSRSASPFRIAQPGAPAGARTPLHRRQEEAVARTARNVGDRGISLPFIALERHRDRGVLSSRMCLGFGIRNGNGNE